MFRILLRHVLNSYRIQIILFLNKLYLICRYSYIIGTMTSLSKTEIMSVCFLFKKKSDIVKTLFDQMFDFFFHPKKITRVLFHNLIKKKHQILFSINKYGGRMFSFLFLSCLNFVVVIYKKLI